MAYAVVWLLAADRAAGARRGASASMHVASFALIALPLLLEATARFELLDPWQSATALGGGAALGLGVAAHRRQQGLAWIVTPAAVLCAVSMVIITGRIAPYAAVLVLLGGATLWMGYLFDWFALRWPVAFVIDLLVLVLGVRSTAQGAADTPVAALGVQILLLATYLGSAAARTLFRNRDVVPFEVVQSVAAIVIGLGGAAFVTRTTGMGGPVLGIASLLLGVGCYAVAVAFVERRQGRRKNFYFYTSAALVFVLFGAALLLSPEPLALAWVAGALLALWAGRRSGRATFHAHGVAYVIAAAIVSGLVLHEAHGLGLPVSAGDGLRGIRLAVLAACIAGAVLAAPGARWRPSHALQRLPRLVLLVLAVTGIAGVLADALMPVMTRLVGVEATGGAMATLCTALLVLATVALAWLAGARAGVEAGWLVHPFLIVIGIKFLAHDLRASRPATLFLAFAFYGVALIVAPRLRRRGSAAPTEPVTAKAAVRAEL
jgi:hypothetical protein